MSKQLDNKYKQKHDNNTNYITNTSLIMSADYKPPIN